MLEALEASDLRQCAPLSSKYSLCCHRNYTEFYVEKALTAPYATSQVISVETVVGL